MGRSRLGAAIPLMAALMVMWGEVAAQVGPDLYVVYFTDKDHTPYSLDKPEEFLSPRAILRRYRQGIPFGKDDLPVDPAYVNALKSMGELRVVARLKWFNAVLLETSDSAVIAAIADLPYVDEVKARRPLRRIVHPIGGADFPKSSKDSYGAALHQIEMINGLPLHMDGFRGEGMVIAVLDAGFTQAEDAPAFARLFDEHRVLATKNFVDPPLDVYRKSTHGSIVLSTMAGFSPDTLIGTAPEASYVLCLTEEVDMERRVEGVWWAAAAEYADSIGADIINSSLGYSLFDLEEENYTYADMDGSSTLITRAANRAAEKGILVVNSAGNSGHLDWHYITAPSDGDKVLAVGAITGDSLAAPFSSRGPRPDGVVKPDVMARGVAAAYANMNGGPALAGNGTSLASPIVAGMAASLWQAVPEASAAQVRSAIQRSAHLYEMPNDSMGYGIPDFGRARDILTMEAKPVGELPTPGSLTIYPNPYSGGFLNLRVAASCGAEGVLDVYDIRGRRVLSHNVGIVEGWIRLDHPADLAPGVYILKLKCASGMEADGRLVVGSRP